MKTLSCIYLSIIIVALTLLLSSCKKKEVPVLTTPVLTTVEVSNFAQTTAVSGGNISDEGSSPVISRGVCWSTKQNPTTSDNITTEGTGTGSFTSTLTGLTLNTTYYVRAYATNSNGTGYGNQKSFIIDNYVITGTVIDQVTKQPAAGATIIFGWLPTNGWGYQLVSSGKTATSGQDGRYKILIPVLALDPEQIRNSLNYPYLYAEKDGYAGSSYMTPPKGGEMGTNIELYHKATLSLLVKNDTINNQIDGVDIGIIGNTGFMSYPGFIGQTTDFLDPRIFKTCKGRNFNTVFEFYPLWGNLTYRLTVRKSDQGWGAPWSSNYNVTLKADSVINFSISF